MEGVDAVVHNAGMYEFGLDAAGNRRMHDINVTGTDNVLGLAHEAGLRRAVHVSSVACWGDSGPTALDETAPRPAKNLTWYEQTKNDAHSIALQYAEKGLDTVIVCPNQVIGPNDHSVYGYFLRLYLNGWLPPMAWDPEVIQSFVHVDDLAEGIALATEKGRAGQTFFLCGEPMARRPMLDFWNRYPGGSKFRIYAPRPVAYAMVAPMGPLLMRLGLPPFLSGDAVTGSVHRFFSGAKACSELGWSYRTAEQAWTHVVEEELKLVAARKNKGWKERLKPV
jgi:dihydroflavonol-4-reductase